MTLDDLRSPGSNSGFRHVRKVGGQPSRGTAVVYYQAQSGSGAARWHGPGRRNAEEAARDYLDYLTNQKPQPTLKSAGHKYDIERTERDPEEEAALGVLRDIRAQRKGEQGFVYCISDGEYVKVGYSVNPAKRVAELQTGNARPLRVLATMEGTLEDERRLHAQYAYNNVLQEWFEPDTDLLAEFDLADDDVSALTSRRD